MKLILKKSYIFEIPLNFLLYFYFGKIDMDKEKIESF